MRPWLIVLLMALCWPGHADETAIKHALAEGQYRKVVRLCESELERLDTEPASDPLERARLLLRYGFALKGLGRFEDALQRAGEALKLYQQTNDPALAVRRQAAQAELLLGEVQIERGRFSDAKGRFQKALEGLTELRDRKSSRLRAQAFRGLGSVAKSRGRFGRAKTFYGVSLKLCRSGRYESGLAHSLNNLGALSTLTRDYPAAEEYYLESLQRARSTRVAGHPDIAAIQSNLAQVYHRQGRYKEAVELLREALDGVRTGFGANSPRQVAPLTSLAIIEAKRGRFKSARRDARLALRLTRQAFGPDSHQVALQEQTLAGLLRPAEAETLHRHALPIIRSTYGDAHPIVRTALINGATNLIRLKHREPALECAREADLVTLNLAHQVFSYASEAHRTNFRKTISPFVLFLSLESAHDLLSASLHYKGVVLDSLLEDHRLALALTTPAHQKVAHELQRLKEELSHFWSQPKPDPAERRRLETSKRVLEERLATVFGRLGQFRTAFTVTVEDVQSQLTEGTVLLEFVESNKLDARARAQRHYAAVVLTHSGLPRFVDLGPADLIDKEIRAYHRAVRRRAGWKASQRLYALLWAPLAPLLPTHSKDIVLSPDGQLSFVSFATLWTPEGRFLGEDYRLSYVTSGRDLLWRSDAKENVRAVFMGDPNFQLSLPKVRESGDHQRPRYTYPELPFTRKECESLAQEFSMGGDARLVLGEQATEAKLRSLASPKVLHLATHGYFHYGDQEQPMDRSGLALAGANGPNPEALDPSNDGLLTAAEASTLELSGTRLVTLSACDTASGVAQEGLGVFGLRRGFLLAGAQNLVTTLWPVEDEETAQLMLEFYRGAREVDVPTALSETQARWLKRLRTERSASEAITVAGPFILHSQGAPAQRTSLR